VTLVFDRRAELAGRPGTHALLCGVNAYPHLNGGSAPPTPYSFGMTQLEAPVRTARALHDWLVDRADQLAAPLATTRLLVAPGPESEADVARDVAVAVPTLENILRAAREWRDDAAAHRDGLTIFYFSGHGFVLSRADQLVLLADYGNGVGSILHNAINVGSIVQGMAPTEWTPQMARTQLYFVDSGQRFEALPPEFGVSTATQVFDVPLDAGTDRVAITFSPAPGEVAYGVRGGLSIFGDALLECLDGAAAELTSDGWGITTLGLVRALPELVKDRTAKHGIHQDVTAGGLIGPALVARLKEPPKARLEIAVPEEAGAAAVVTVRDASFLPVLEAAPDAGGSLQLELPAGLYVIELKRPEQQPTLETVALMPGFTTHLRLEAAARQ
jgi:hypothetical protein